jgi:hypothetical protein
MFRFSPLKPCRYLSWVLDPSSAYSFSYKKLLRPSPPTAAALRGERWGHPWCPAGSPSCFLAAAYWSSFFLLRRTGEGQGGSWVDLFSFRWGVNPSPVLSSSYSFSLILIRILVQISRSCSCSHSVSVSPHSSRSIAFFWYCVPNLARPLTRKL